MNFRVEGDRVIDENGRVGILYSPSAGYVQEKQSYTLGSSTDGVYDDATVWSTNIDTGVNDPRKLFCPLLVLHLANGGTIKELRNKRLTKKGTVVLQGLPDIDALDRVVLEWIPPNKKFKVSIRHNDGGPEEFIEYYDESKWFETHG
jgi:hypothetical protein